MAKKRGRPPKIKADGTVSKKKMADVETLLPANSNDVGMVAMSDREAMYERAEAANRGEVVPDEPTEVSTDMVDKALEELDVVPEETTAEETTEKVETIEEVVEEVKEKKEETTETSTEKEETVISAEKETAKPEKDKTVPHGAFHEEREERKKAQADNKELRRQNEEYRKQQEQMIADFKAKNGDYETEEETELKTLRRDVQNLKDQSTLRDQSAIESENARAIDIVNDELEAEGKYGFKSFAEKYMQTYMTDWNARDPEMAKAHDNMEGWKKVYLDHILPDLKGIANQNTKTELFDKKKERKLNAQLITDIGKKTDEPVVQKKTKTPYEQYLEERKNTVL